MWKKAVRNSKLKPVDLLQQLEESLQDEIADLNFNYLTLAGQCLTLLALVIQILELSGMLGPPSPRSPSGKISPIELVPQVLLGPELSSGGESSSHRRRYDFCAQMMKSHVVEN